jgi:hypothetical protein
MGARWLAEGGVVPTLAEQRAELSTLPFVVLVPDEVHEHVTQHADDEEDWTASQSIVVW